MPDEQTIHQSGSKANKKRSLLDIVAVIVIVALFTAAAFHQEELTGFFKLHAWDRGAPGRAVVEFLKAGKEGKQAQADDYIGTPLYQPLTQNGKWVGYSTKVQDTKLLFTFDDMIPATALEPTSTEFSYAGAGSADVVVPNKEGKPVTYSLARTDRGWKIITIGRGRME